MRRFRLVTAAFVAVIALSLAGCASSPSPQATTGAAVSAISVTGVFGKKPRVDMPTPIVAETTQCEEVITGSGNYVQEGQMVSAELSIYNGSTGKLIQQTSYDGSNPQSLIMSDKMLPGLQKGLSCARDGSRIVVVIPPDEAFGDTGNSQWNIAGDDSLVLVIDVKQIFLARADGAPQLSQDGMPMVVLAPNGQPGVSVPNAPAPTSQRVSVLKKGSGATVESGQTVTVHYTGVLWSSGEVFDSSWTTGSPIQVRVGDGVNDQGEVIQGFSDAVIGQTVGSQVLVVIPPELAYGNQSSSKIPANSTLVFVIDILGVS